MVIFFLDDGALGVVDDGAIEDEGGGGSGVIGGARVRGFFLVWDGEDEGARFCFKGMIVYDFCYNVLFLISIRYLMMYYRKFLIRSNIWVLV